MATETDIPSKDSGVDSSTEQKPVTFADKVNTLANEATRDDQGVLQLPEGTDEATAFSVNAELRRRTTQSEHAKERNRADTLEAENTKLAEGWQEIASGSLTTEQAAELEELKASDPEAWRLKLNEYEEANRTAFAEKRTGITKAAKAESEIEQRTRLMEEFNTANPELEITDDILANDIPPRYLKQLETGEISFEKFLEDVKGFLTKGKVLKKEETPLDDPDLTNSGGSSTPSDTALEAEESYGVETY